jgi:hypothetical protein
MELQGLADEERFGRGVQCYVRRSWLISTWGWWWRRFGATVSTTSSKAHGRGQHDDEQTPRHWDPWEREDAAMSLRCFGAALTIWGGVR